MVLCQLMYGWPSYTQAVQPNELLYMRPIGLYCVFIAFSLASGQPFAGSTLLQQQTGAEGESSGKTPDTTQSQRPQAAGSGEPQAASPAAPAARVNPREVAWKTLEEACSSQKAFERASATLALGLVRNNAKARKLAEDALADPKPEVRSAGASALGEMGSKKSIPNLRKALDDQEPSVALGAAYALLRMHDRSSYAVFDEILTGRRKGGKGLLAAEKSTLSDPKKVAELGFEEGIGFIPFAGIGWSAYKEVRKNDSSPVRAASARALTDDPDPATTKVLAEEAGDKNWTVRAAALESLAKRGDPSALDTVEIYIEDEKDIVRYTAAAATLRRLAVRETKSPAKQRVGSSAQ